MTAGFQPVGAALPQRRDSLVSAADAVPAAPSGVDWGTSINVPLARDRLLEYFEREQLPGDVKSTLAAALNGDLHYQHLLFTAMIDTWPKLQKAIDEIGRLVSVAPWKTVPYAIRGEKPDKKAEAMAKDVDNMLWGMRPRAAYNEHGLEETIKELVRGYYYGHGVMEVRWMRGEGGKWQPRATKTVPPRYYGYPYDLATTDDKEDRLMFDPDGGMGARAFIDFPEHRFLVGIHCGHSGHPSVAAPLRSLAGYWLAAVYGLKWFLNFTQLYGIPWRHAEVADSGDENKVKAALASIGINGYIVTKPNTKINVLESAKNGQQIPQRELIQLADDQVTEFILGQTLTSGTDGSGSRALGEVHQGTLDGVVDGVADWVGAILTRQLVPSIVALNWGAERTDCPEFWAKREVAKDEKALAERDEKLGIIDGTVPVGKAWFYERHGIPIPAEGDDLLIEEPEETEGDLTEEPPQLGPDGKPVEKPGKMPPNKPQAPPKKPMPAKIEAADATDWKAFHKDCGSMGIPRREMPQIKSGDRAAMVQFMRARGIDSKQEEIAASSLKPCQAEYSPAKVQMARDYKGGNRSILISEDGYIIDGHHQWKAALDDGQPVKATRLMAPATRVLMMVHRMPSTSVAAADATNDKTLTVDKLSDAVLEGLTNVAPQWLSPVRPMFERLAALAMSKHVTDDDFVAALEKAQREMPEIFGLLDTKALEDAFEAAISSAALAGSVSRYEQ